MATIGDILARKWPGAQWCVEEDSHASLQWLSEGEPPTEAEIRVFSAEVDQLMLRERMAVTPMQFRLALDAAGLLDACEAAVAAAPRAVQIVWNHAVLFERLSPLIAQFAAELEIAPEEVDAVFEAAGLPPEKWSSLKYGFAMRRTWNGEEAAHSGRDRHEAAAG